MTTLFFYPHSPTQRQALQQLLSRAIIQYYAVIHAISCNGMSTVKTNPIEPNGLKQFEKSAFGAQQKADVQIHISAVNHRQKSALGFTFWEPGWKTCRTTCVRHVCQVMKSWSHLFTTCTLQWWDLSALKGIDLQCHLHFVINI